MNTAAIGVLLIIVLAICIVTVVMSIAFVGAGERAVVTHWGAVNTEEVPRQPGMMFKTPFQDNVYFLSVQTQKYPHETDNISDTEDQGIKIGSTSKDIQDVFTEVIINYHLNGEAVNRLYANIGIDYASTVIEPNLKQTVKEVMAKYTATELVTNRQAVSMAIEDDLRASLSGLEQCKNCIILESVSIVGLSFTDQFSKAIEDKVTAIQKADQARNDLERIKIEAEQAVALAEGQALSITVVENALAGSPNYMQWLATQKWDGKVPLVVGGESMPLIQLP